MATEPPPADVTQEKLNLWLNDFMRHLKEFTETRHAAGEALGRCYLFEMESIEPMLSLWGPNEHLAGAVGSLREVQQTLEAWARATDAGEGGRDLLRDVWAKFYRLRQELIPDEDNARPAGTRLHDIAWQTYLGDNGEILFDAGGGHVVALRGDLGRLSGAKVIAMMADGVPPYPEAVRPLDVRGKPGGLIRVAGAERLIVVGDIHGRYSNLENILRDKENLKSLKRDNAHILFLGDAIHPGRAGGGGQKEAYADSFRVMFLILSLKAEMPDRVHYLVGNHENAHLGGLGAVKAEESEHVAFQKYVRNNFGEEVLKAYLRFLEHAPVVARFATAAGDLIFIHGGPARRIRTEQSLIDICAGGRRGKGLTDVLWNRNFEPEIIDAFLDGIGAKFIVAGHTRPTMESASKYGYKVVAEMAFGEVAGKLLLLNSQGGTFGYLDIDLTRPLGKRVDDMQSPVGKAALRLFKPRTK